MRRQICLSAIGLIDKKSIRGITDEPLRPRTSSSLVRIRLSRSDIRLSRTSTTAPFSLTAIFVVNTLLRPRRNSGSFNGFSGYFIYDSYIPTITSYKPHRTIWELRKSSIISKWPRKLLEFTTPFTGFVKASDYTITSLLRKHVKQV